MGTSARPTWPRWWHVFLLLPPLAATGWVVLRGQRLREDPRAVLKVLEADRPLSLPSTSETGAMSRTDPVRYDRDSLYEVIDGAAESYIGNGFREALFSTYTIREGLEIAAELHRFESAQGARTQFSSERPSTATAVDGWPEALTDGSMALVMDGNAFLKLTSLSSDPGARTALVSLAQAWRKEKRP